MLTEQHRRPVRIAVYVILVASAATAFLLGDQLWARARLGDLPTWAPLVPPSLFTLFVFVYAIDRWLLVRRRATSGSRALFQVAFAIVFMSLLWPDNLAELRQLRSAPGGPRLGHLLSHRDPEVRAAACELAGLRQDLDSAELVGHMARDDKDGAVRTACAEAVARLAEARAAMTPR